MCAAVWSGFPVLKLRGELDIARRQYLDKALEPAKRSSRVTLDLREVDFLDAGALSSFVHLHNHIHPLRDLPGTNSFQPSIRLINVQSKVARVIYLLQLDKLFEVEVIGPSARSDANNRSVKENISASFATGASSIAREEA
jgi:anti-anti-sigma factor